MKRVHVSLAVSDLAKSREFYAKFFGAEPTMERDHYIQWLMDDPAINFVIEDGEAKPGLTHLGIQVQDEEQLEQQFARTAETGGKVIDQGETQCCYARSTKNWTIDPDGHPWETFLTHERISDFGTPFVGSAEKAGENLESKAKKPAVTHCGCC